MALTASQEEKMLELVGYIREGCKRIVLKGSAGVGKTFMTNELIRRLKTTLYQYGAIYVNAPTHKALAVLKTKIEEKPYIHFQTVHSSLQLRRQINYATGSTFYVKGPENKRNPPYRSAQCVLLDECSMIGRDILDYINEYPNLTFIFIGDDKQINPVNEADSPVFLQGYPTVELTEIIRQGAGNPIIDLSRNLNRIFSKQSCLTEQGGYFYENSRDTIITKLAEVNGSDDIKYLSWTNVDVDKVNHDVRIKIYGTPNKVELGESLIFASPFRDEFKNNDEIKVETLEVKEKLMVVPTSDTIIQFTDGMPEIKKVMKGGIEVTSYDTAEVKCYLINGTVEVLHESCEQLFKSICNKLKADCKNGYIKWPVYYWFFEQFANITYNHAITVHKSQGSTYKVAILNASNINLNKNIPEKTRLFYTAVTRASGKVVLFNVK